MKTFMVKTKETLTEADKAKMADRMASIPNDEAEIKEEIKSLKEKLRQLKKEDETLNQEVYSGFVIREYECRPEYNTPKAGMVRMIRLSDGECLSERAMETSDYTQMEIEV